MATGGTKMFNNLPQGASMSLRRPAKKQKAFRRPSEKHFWFCGPSEFYFSPQVGGAGWHPLKAWHPGHYSRLPLLAMPLSEEAVSLLALT